MQAVVAAALVDRLVERGRAMAGLEAVGDLDSAGTSPHAATHADPHAATLDGLIDAARRLVELHPGLITLRVAHGDDVIEMDCSPRARGSAAPPPGRHRRAPDTDV